MIKTLSPALSLASLLALLVGCVSAQERFARRINCEVADTRITDTVNAPGYTSTSGTCKAVKYTCRDAPFWSSCKPDSDWDEKK